MQKKVIIILSAVIVLLISGIVTFFVLTNQSEKVTIYTYDPGEFFITNVMDSKSLIKADMLFEVSNKDTNEFLTENQFKVRDVVIKVLRGKTQSEIMKADIQMEIEKDVIKELSETYQLEGIDHVYFNEFVVQQ